MKIEVGMYVKKKNGRIGKILEIDERKHCVDNLLLDLKNSIYDVRCGERNIRKSSFDIIDLIEEGDLCIIEFYSPRYDERIERLFEIEYKKDNTINFQNAHCNLNMFDGVWSNEDKELKPIIKSIVTKEQFENASYKIGDDE